MKEYSLSSFFKTPASAAAASGSASLGSFLTKSIIASVVDAAISILVGPSKRSGEYAANFGNTNLLPSIAEMLHAWSRGGLEQSRLINMVKSQGVDLETNVAWQEYMKSLPHAPSVDMLIALFQLGRAEGADRAGGQWRRMMDRNGFKDEEVRRMLLNSPYIFSPEQSRTLFWLTSVQGEGYPTNEDGRTYRRRLSAAGMPNEQDQAAFNKLIQPPTYKECIDLLNRDLLLPGLSVVDAQTGELRAANQAEREAEFNRLMIHEGYNDPLVIKYLRSLAQEFPTESELIDMSVKNVFSKHLSEILQLDDEYEEQPQYIVWTDRRGLSGSPTINRQSMREHMQAHRLTVIESAQGDEQRLAAIPGVQETERIADEYYEAQDTKLLSWAQAFWREHWVNLSPTQIYTCLHRLRPIDTTKPGGMLALDRYMDEIAPLNEEYNENAARIAAAQAGEGHGGNNADIARLHKRQEEIVARRYAIAVRYSKTWGRVQTVPGSTEPVPPVTMDIVRTVLRANDYAPRFRDSLAAISYNVLRLVDIRRVVQVSLRNPEFAQRAIGYDPRPGVEHEGEQLQLAAYVRAWAREQFLDRGQTPDAATVLAELSITQGRQANTVIARATNPAGRRRYVRLLDKAIGIGLIDRQAYNRFLERLEPRGGDGAAAVAISTDVYSDDLTAQDVADDSQWQIAFSEEEAVAVAEDVFDGFGDEIA